LNPDESAKIAIEGLKKGKYLIVEELFPGEIIRLLKHGISHRDHPIFDLLVTPIVTLVSPIVSYFNDMEVRALKKKQKKE